MTESSTVKLRLLTVAAVTVLAAAGLTGCRSNVGSAATVDGEKITDSQVADYVTPSAQPVQVGQNQEVAPRTFVVQILVYGHLFREIAEQGPNGGPSSSAIAQAKQSALGGKSPKQYAEAQSVRGYSASFDRKLVDYLAYRSVLQGYQQQGVDVGALIKKVKISVHISPRYGEWDAKGLAIDNSASAGLPGFISLQPGGGASSSPVVQVPADN